MVVNIYPMQYNQSVMNTLEHVTKPEPINTPEPAKFSLDLVGLGKVANAIPPEVYKQTTAMVLKTFEALVAPFTQTTAGLGQLIRQTFDNWVQVRKAIGTYTWQQAVIRARARA